MKLKDQAVIFQSFEEKDVQGSFGEPYAVANISVGDETLQVAFARQIPESDEQLSKIAKAFRAGHENVQQTVSVNGVVNIGKIEGDFTAAQQIRLPMGSFPAMGK